KEVTTDDIFPGGMMTMLIIEPWTVDLDAGTGTGGYPGGVTPPPTLPTLALLDNFNRTNANTLGANWQQYTFNYGFLGGVQAGIRVNGNQAFCTNSGIAFLNCALGANAYRTPALGVSQAAALTFSTVSNNTSLLLKATGTLSALGVYPNVIRVRYNGGQVFVETTANGATFTSAGTLPGTFAVNDILTAMADATGTVYVWKTSGLVSTLLGSAPTSFTGSGQIGLYLPPGARVDNFAGGTP
ncbi:MAG TPA: hypothetical protein PK497_00005, partial [Burkholderiaceae bacterium]|nr:hypothetical protein [Burkholderiaceae bacterium]